MFMSSTKHEIGQSQSRAVTEKKCTKKCETPEVVVLLNIRPIVFLLFSSTSPLLLFKVPYNAVAWEQAPCWGKSVRVRLLGRAEGVFLLLSP